MSLKYILIVLVILTISSIPIYDHFIKEDKQIIDVIHAGSLAGPMTELERLFEVQNPGVDVRRRAMGSTAAVREVTELDKSYDVLASADYTLIDSMMVESEPVYADYSILFAKNQMTIAYTDESKYRDMINESNWFDVLNKDDVRFGFSNPNDDPCGYRSLMVIQLAELYYGNDEIFDLLVGSNTGITSTDNNGSYVLKVPASPEIDLDVDKIMMRSAEIHLMSALELGEIDYLFIYRSVAHQHRSSGVSYLVLPESIDLSSVNHTEFYSQVKVIPSSGKVLTAKPIIYGITIPRTVQNFDLAVEFIEFVLDEKGQEVFFDLGQPPIVPAKCEKKELLPPELGNYVE